ncbi:MAG: 50S ribosomal protein L20 [Elusimicrobia bacterium]|nr:50S ribosomal protein L20 [Elusimicrobiota bacterium]
MRIKGGVYTRQRKKKFFRFAKGSYASKRSRWRQVIQQVERSLRFAYRDRRDRKGTFRRLWITRINAATRQHGLSYSRLMAGLRRAGVLLDRRSLAELAVADAPVFQKLVALAKQPVSPSTSTR